MDSADANTLLLMALAARDVSEVTRALRQGADANLSGLDGRRPLHTAAYDECQDMLRIIDLLLSHGAKVNAADEDGFTPLMVAALNDHTDVARKLLKARADPVVTRLDTGETALHLAMNKNSFATATKILDAGADVHAVTKVGSTALHFAAEFGNVRSVEALVRHPGSVGTEILKAKNSRGETPAQVAISKGHQELAHRLDMFETPQTPAETMMISALLNTNAAELEEAINQGADVNHPTLRGDRPIHAAAVKGSVQIIQLLLSKRAEVDVVDTEGNTPLMVAALNGHAGAVEKLLAFGADPKRQTFEGEETALHFAMAHDSQIVVQVLLENGADINAKMADGSTPLHLAAEYNALSSAEEMLSYTFCERDLKDTKGRTPCDVARGLSHQEFLRLLSDPDEVDGNVCESQTTEGGSLNLRVIYGQIRQPSIDVYKNIAIPRGYVLIINNTFKDSEHRRNGSTTDVHNLKNLFTKMGYDVEAKEDLSKRETLQILGKFSKDPKLDKADSVFVSLLSHGDEGKFVTSDDQLLDEKEVYNMFKDSQCPLLKGKPKVFLFNFCRGQYLETRSAVHIRPTVKDSISLGFAEQEEDKMTDAPRDMDQSEDKMTEAPRDMEQSEDKMTEAPRDMLSIFASVDGIKALRHPIEGTYFVKTLCQIFAKFAHKDHIMDLATKICDHMRIECLTTPEVKNYHFKKLYLNPYTSP